MRGGGESQIFFIDAEHSVSIEIDALDVCRDCLRTKRSAEAQTNVLRIETQKVIQQFRTCGLGKTVNVDGTHSGPDSTTDAPLRRSAQQQRWAPKKNRAESALGRTDAVRGFIVRAVAETPFILPRPEVQSGAVADRGRRGCAPHDSAACCRHESISCS